MVNPGKRNVDETVVEGFGDEWSRFDQTRLADDDLQHPFDEYFAIFPWDLLPPDAAGFDAGCGSGRWAKMMAPRVGKLLCVDASPAAAAVARRNLAEFPNCEVVTATIDEIPLPDGSADFGYSLGVLHHVPATGAALRSCTRKLKSGAPFLVYLYYAFDNQPLYFRLIWKVSEPVRFVISRMPHALRYVFSQLVAGLVYWPLARTARLLEKLGMDVHSFPLSYYRSRPFYTLRTDALDRFGTRLEQRFTRQQIDVMMRDAGLTDVRFSDKQPFWCAVGIKR